MSIYNFYNYKLDKDEIQVLNFLLKPHLYTENSTKIFQNIKECQVKHFAFRLLQNGCDDDSKIAFLQEALYHLPRIDILFECNMEYNEFDKCGKSIDIDRLLLYKFYDETETNDFKEFLKIIFKKKCVKSDFYYMEYILKNPDYMAKTLKYFKKFSLPVITDYIKLYENKKLSGTTPIIESSTSQIDPKRVIAIEKGNFDRLPQFGKSNDGRLEFFEYESEPSLHYLSPNVNQPKSLCLVFNNYDYEKRRRNGWENDERIIKNTFEKLHFEVYVAQNLKHREMLDLVEGCTKDIQNAGAMVVCFIMAHGEENCIYDIEENKMNLQVVFQKFTAKSCSAYQDKPKLFFIQACQGSEYHPVAAVTKVETACDGNASATYIPISIERDGNVKKSVDKYNVKEAIPNEADFYFGYATLPGYVAARSKTTGSFFIQELCSQIDKFSHKKDIDALFKNVIAEVSQIKIGYNQCQLPCVQYTLRKKCYLQTPIMD